MTSSAWWPTRLATPATLSIPGAAHIRHVPRRDERGYFRALFRDIEVRDLVGHSLDQYQMNVNRSYRGALRGIHATTAPHSGGKFATCLNGTVLQVLVDLRVGSPTFTESISFEMSGDCPESVYCPPGVGHAIMALSDDVVVSYLITQRYEQHQELAINPMDPTLGIDWPSTPSALSTKDRRAPSITEALQTGLLPRYVGRSLERA